MTDRIGLRLKGFYGFGVLFSPHLVQVGAGARREGLGARVEVGEGVGGESLLRPTPDRGETHCNDPCNNYGGI